MPITPEAKSETAHMPDDPKQPMSSEELIRRAREGLDSDSDDDFQLPSYTAVRHEAEVARAERDAAKAQAEVDARLAEAEADSQESAAEPDVMDPAAGETDTPDEIAAGHGSLEPATPGEDIYGPVVTPQSGENGSEPAAKRGFQFRWLRWLIAAGFIGFILFRIFDPSTSVDNLSIGDCFDDPGGNEIASVDLIDCSEPHEYEIYALIQLSGNADEFPGDEALFDELADICFERFESYVAHDYATSVYDFSGLTPLQDSWKSGDREGICLVHRFDESGVIRKSSSAAGAGI
jgi:hypothetical protein